MKHIVHILLLGLLLLSSTASAQQLRRFTVAEFMPTPLDLTAVSESGKRTDNDGALYAVIKVKSDLPDDELKAYQFDFGLMNSFVEFHPDDEELWVYVQKNAKTVSIRREGFISVNKYDLHTTIDAGKTYTMTLSVNSPVVLTQMVMFRVKPAIAKAVVMVKDENEGGAEEVFGMVDETGAVAKSLPFGHYSYRVAAENFYTTDGAFTLNNQTETHIEEVTLRGNFATITLQVASDADIYVDGEKKGLRSWTGILKAGSHQVECRQLNHKSVTQAITVAENENRTLELSPPIPITGTLSITSRPLGADIIIDGKNYGQTPKNIPEMLVGHHTVELTTHEGQGGKQEFDIQENQTTHIEMTLQQNVVSSSNEQTFTVEGHGKRVTFKMIRVEAGTFQMGGSGGKPVHQVTLSKNYFIGETEVTQGLWYTVMGEKCTSPVTSMIGVGDNFPAYDISYEECQQFLTKLNQLTGQQFRFPTEAEWEFAARGGTKSKGYTYAGSNTIRDVAWYDLFFNGPSSPDYGTHVVKSKNANELGLYDMSGNVSEWCADWYGSYSKRAVTDPTGPATGSKRVIRGGSWWGSASSCKVSSRSKDSPSERIWSRGLRLAL